MVVNASTGDLGQKGQSRWTEHLTGSDPWLCPVLPTAKASDGKWLLDPAQAVANMVAFIFLYKIHEYHKI